MIPLGIKEIQYTRPHWCFIAIGEKDMYDLTEEEVEWVEDIVRIYMYDKNRYTFCCESTPSHWMVPMRNRIDIKPQYMDREHDILRDNLESDIFPYDDRESCYMHAPFIEKLETEYMKDPHKSRYYLYDCGESDERYYSDDEYRDLEYEMGNTFAEFGYL